MYMCLLSMFAELVELLSNLCASSATIVFDIP
jgi:hypothetical protein